MGQIKGASKFSMGNHIIIINSEPVISALKRGMRLTGCRGDFDGLRMCAGRK